MPGDTLSKLSSGSRRSTRFGALALLAMLASAASSATTTADRIENLAAYARLLSLLRFFHPSDQAAAADWRKVAIGGIARVEAAADAAGLATVLERYFAPLAPTLCVTVAGTLPALPATLGRPSGAGPFRILAWRHYAGNFGGDPHIFTSERIDDQEALGFGTLAQAIDARPLRGRQVRVGAIVRVTPRLGGHAELRLRVDRSGGRSEFYAPPNPALRSPAWQRETIEARVAADADQVALVFVLSGGGSAWLDDVTLETGDQGDPAHFANASFDEGTPGTQPPGWTFPYASVHAGYHVILRRGEECWRGGCAEIASDEIATPQWGLPEAVEKADLGGGVVALVPIRLWADAKGSLPHTDGDAPLPAWTAIDPGADSHDSRLAAIALAWGIGEHLHPEMAAHDRRWEAALPLALAAADRARDRTAFDEAPLELLAGLGDVRTARLLHRQPQAVAALPLAWGWFEDRLVVTGIQGKVDGVLPGDEVVTLEGRAVAALLAERIERVGGPSLSVRRSLALEESASGPQGVRVRLGLRRQGRGAFEVGVERRAVDWVADTPLPRISEPRPGVLYLDLRRLDDRDLEPLWPRLAASRGLVFDLRGQTEVSTVLLSHFAQRTARSSTWQVPVVLFPDHREVQWLTTFWSIEPKAPHLGGAIAFVVDERALGYAETLLGMVEHYGWGEIVGRASAGANGNLNSCLLPGDVRMFWTAGRVLKHDGSPWYGVGVRPTVAAERTIAGIAAGRDEMVERAVEVVSGWKSPS